MARSSTARSRTTSLRLGGKRANINGAVKLGRLESVVRFDDTINAESRIALFERLDPVNLLAARICVICGNVQIVSGRKG